MSATAHERCSRAALPFVVLSVGLAGVACTNTSNNAAGRILGTAGASGGTTAMDASSAIGAGGTSMDAAPEGPAHDLGYLWFAGSALNAFTKKQTESSNDDGPKFVFVPDFSVTNLHDVVFDRSGSAWVIPISGNQIIRFQAGSLISGAPPVPDLVLAGPSLSSPTSLAFDLAGNLWVLNYDGAGSSVANVVRFDNPQSLSGSAGPTASATISPGTAAADKFLFSQASSIVFDASNNLWLVSVSHVLRFDSPTSLQGNVTGTPAAVLSTMGDAYAAAAFDAGGSMWITGAHAGYFVLRIDNPGALTGTVTEAPSARAQLPSDMASFAAGMAFDADGALWIALSNRLIKLPDAAALSGTMTVTPSVVLGLIGLPDLTSKLVIRPQPPGLPIY